MNSRTPKFFDPLKFFMHGMASDMNMGPDPKFDEKVAILLQEEIKETTAQLVLTSDHKMKKELTDRLAKLQNIYQGFLTGERITRIVQLVEETNSKDKLESLGLSEMDKATLLDKVKERLEGISSKVVEAEFTETE